MLLNEILFEVPRILLLIRDKNLIGQVVTCTGHIFVQVITCTAGSVQDTFLSKL